MGINLRFSAAWLTLITLVLVGLVSPNARAQVTYNPTTGVSATGGTLYAACTGCHGASAQFSIAIRNAANAGWIINLAMANGMGGYTSASYTPTQEADLAAYISNLFSSTATNPSLQAVAHNAGGTAISLPNIYMSTGFGTYSIISSTSGPARGSVSYSGATATYTPTTGQCGSDSFSWQARGFIDTPPVGGGTDTYYSNVRTSSVSIANPSVPNISGSAGTMSGTAGIVISTFTPTNSSGTPLSYSLTGTLPTGLNFSTSTGQISGTPTQAGTFNVTVNAFNCSNGNLAGQSGSRAVSITIAQGTQTISFGALANKLTTDAPFTVSATGGGSGNPVTFTTSGVCTQSGTNGSTITLSGAAGICTVAANQAGNANYAAAAAVMQSFTVSDPTSEVFPPNCAMPPGWIQAPGSNASWSVATDSASAGLCSLRSNAIVGSFTGLNTARLQITGTFDAGNITLSRRVSSESAYKCFRLLIDSVPQDVLGSCTALGGFGASGIVPFGAASIPIAAGSRTVTLSYERDSSCCVVGADAAWVDQLSMPLSTSINSATFAFGTFNTPLSYTLTATNFPATLGASNLPPGMSFNASTGVISGTPTAAGTFTTTVTASNPAGANPAASDLKTVSFFIGKSGQSIIFNPLNNRLTTAPSFVASAAGGGSLNAVTFTASGVCSSSGTNGATIVLTGVAGTCTVTASQLGNANYSDASDIARSFEVLLANSEIFPPACSMPSGWTTTAGPGWAVSANEESTSGACSLKSTSTVGSNVRYQTEVSYSGTFSAGVVSFKYRISTEPNYKCFQFFIDTNPQNLAGNCTVFGLVGVSGETTNWVSVSFPITAGAHTLRWRYDKDSDCCIAGTRDAIWIDDVVMPQYTLTVIKAGPANGTISSTPAGIDSCGGTCSTAISGNVLLTPTAGFLGVFAGWSGGGCSGTGNCTVTMDASKSVTGTFNSATPPSAPQNVVATPANASTSISFTQPASDGGSAIVSYGAICRATGQPDVLNSGNGSPIVVTGMANGVLYSCDVRASNFAGSGAIATVTVTPRTAPSAPTGATATSGNTTATISFTASVSNGGANISGYTATCTASGQTTRTGTAAGTPITVSSLVNGITYSCSVVATNIAGNSAASNVVSVTPLTVPGAPTIITTAEFDSRVVLNFLPPASDGGSSIIEYETSCAAASQTTRTVLGTGLQVTVNLLTNNVSYTCSVRARNVAGFSSAASAVLLPRVRAGTELYTDVCTGCHVGPPSVPQLNVAGTTATVLNYVIVNQPTMNATPNVTSLSEPERVAIASYLASTISSAAQTTPFNTPKALDFASQITLGSLSFESLEVVAPPTNGTLSAFTGTGITYTPAVGYTGTDSITFRGKRTAPTALNGDARTVNLSVLPPPVPVITSGTTASGTNGAVFIYQITATNSPTGYGATGLPQGLTVNTMTGAITGPPTVGGTFNATIFASNAGGTGMSAPLTITLNAAGQTISFLAQSPGTRAYSPSPSNTFAVDPLATSTSNLPVSYVSKTLSVCTVDNMTATVSMLGAGTCTIGANQAGNPSYTVATEVTQSVTITPTLPGAPTIGTGTPGNNQATIAFTAPANTGGTAITLYSATCTPSGTGTNTVSPIVVGGLVNGTPYTCSVRASNSVGQGPASGTVMVTPTPTPTPPAVTSANATAFTVNAPGSFSVTATGTPATFTYSSTGMLPTGVTFSTTTGVLSGTPTQAGVFPLTLGVSNGVGSPASQSFTLTVAKANQTITFTNPGTRVFSASAVALSAVATSSLTVSFVSDTTGVCTVTGANATLVGVGTCTLRAQQAGNANFNAAAEVTQSLSVVQGSQSITFGAQASPLAFVANSMFALSPVATASSGLVVAYTSLTTGVCSISGTTISMLRAGICTIAANQSGNANYSAAAQVTQSVTLTGSVPGAPIIGTTTGGDTKITVAFTAPASDGGLSISSYTATCGSATASGTGSPINVPGLVNGMAYSCTVTATNSAGTGPSSGPVMATPNALPGAMVWANSCSGCHANPPSGTRLNVGGSTSAVLDYVLANPTAPMGAMVTIVNGSLNAQQKTDVAAYIRDFIPPVSTTTPANTAVLIDVGTQVFLNTSSAALTSLQQVSAPVNGTLSAFTGTTVTYTPNAGFTGTDTFSYRATQASVNTDIRTVSVTVAQAAPTITSALTTTGIVNQAFNYQIAATNAPTAYDAIVLPTGLSVNMSTGVVSGMPAVGATTNVTISATNASGTGSATLAITINLIPQTISFGAQTSPVTYSQGGTVMISPAATGGASGNPVVYSSTTPGVCSVSGSTFTMLSAGICTLAASQAGNATYAAAAQVTQSVSITGIPPSAPTIGTAVAGNTQATINFTAPANTGGLPISSYTVNCNGVTVSGPGSPIALSGLTNGTSYACTVQATNLAGTSSVSGSVMVTPVAIAFTGNVYSRKTHGAAGDKDLTVNGMAAINGAITVEPRALGSGHRIVFRFNNPVSSVTSLSVLDAGMLNVGAASSSFSGNDLIVTLTGIPDNKRVTVTATGVNGALTVSTSIGFLVGDVSNSLSVSAADISAVKTRIGQPVGMGNNFLFDLDANGAITSSDVSAVKARSGLTLSP